MLYRITKNGIKGYWFN